MKSACACGAGRRCEIASFHISRTSREPHLEVVGPNCWVAFLVEISETGVNSGGFQQFDDSFRTLFIRFLVVANLRALTLRGSRGHQLDAGNDEARLLKPAAHRVGPWTVLRA